MASLITVRLSKGDSSSLGFRLQGGKDFGTPLVIQKVNGGSPAERAGLLAGDSVIKVNNTDVFNLRHKDAQDVIIRAGPAFEVTVQRGGSVWKPTVIPTTGPLPAGSPVTKTSLAATKNENIGSIGTGHNLSAKPFSPQLNGAVNGGPKLVNNQYNSPLKLYSEQSIAETLSAQTEVLSTGALGVNFKKNERNYDASNSAVFRMLQEAENEPRTPEAGRSVQNIVWPPPPEEPEVPTACPLYVPPATHLKVIPKTIERDDIEYSEAASETGDLELDEINIMAQYQPKLSLCSEEVCGITERRSATECIETISETLETQKLIENVLKNRPPSPPPLDRDVVISEKRSEIAQCGSCCIKSDFVCSDSKTSCELVRPIDFKPNTVECKLKSQVENVVPKKWESQMVQALRIDPDEDPFTQIPKKHSSSALASALAIAPSEPFIAQPPTRLDPVPLPEETVPYFPPEHPVVIEPKEPKPEKPDSKFVRALQTAPECPFKPVGAAPVKKKKDPTEEFFKELPKPKQKLTMRQALTTASDRPYSPLLLESVNVSESREESKVEESHKVQKKSLLKPLKPAVLPSSFQKPFVEEKPRAPKPFPVMVHEKREEKQEERQIDVKKSTTVEKHQTQSTVDETIEHVDEERPQGMYPLFKGFSCSFENKSEHSQFKIEISTSPPTISLDRSQTPSVKVSRTGASSESITETVTEESQIREKASQQKVEKQTEQVILKKPLPLASILHKPETLPQYQVNLSESVEADLQLMQKIESAKSRHEQQKVCAVPPPKPPREIQTKPIITIQPGDSQPLPEKLFKPVCEDRPPSSTFSPRPRAVTPSMINKPPPIIPYYQASLAPQECRAPEINLLDPTSPAISRSPSPCPDRRSPSPFRSSVGAAAARPKSPAAGPPPNPLKSNKPLPTPRDSKVEEAKRNLTSYIPQYRSKMELVENVQSQPRQMYVAHAEAQSVSGQQLQQNVVSSQQSLQVDCGKKCMMREDRQIEDAVRSQIMSKQTGRGTMSTAISEMSHSDHLEQMRQSERESIEQSSDGRVQVQRKKTVTEEFEHTQKAKMIQIEKNISSSKCHPFKDVKDPVVDTPGIIGMHVTNPQPIASPFLKSKCSQSCSLPLPPSQPQQASSCAPQHQVQALQQSKPPGTPQVKHVPAPSLTSPIRHVSAPSGSAKKPNQNVNKSNIPVPNAGPGSGSGGGRQAGAVGVAPKRGRGVLNTAGLGGTRIPLCASCHSQIRGPFITALGKIWCPEHFTCATPSCRRPLQDLGFVEEQGQLYCEYCFEQYLAPPCSKCSAKIKGDCLKAIGKNFHPECFNCVYCGKLFGNSPFFLEDGNPYCETDWNELFTTKCFACGFPVEAGDRWVEALNNNYHSQCFNCTMCKKNLEGQSFFAKGGRPFCKNHAR